MVSVSVNGVTLAAHSTPIGADSAAPKRATMLVLDVSGSMRGERLSSAKAAAARYVDGLPADVRVGVVEVSTHATVAAAPTADRRR